MKFLPQFLRLALTALFGICTAGLLITAGAYLYVAPDLPSIEQLKDVRFQVPLRVYTRDGLLMAEFGEKRRSPSTYEELPPAMVQAFLAAEDDRFFQHPGVDYQGLLRAAVSLALTGEKRQGGSTITMQVARNFFLSTEKTYLRKVNEIFLALKIERALSKEEILELYLNKIYLGQRAYGVAAAAQVYYGAHLDDLTLPQIAMIAGLPKAPSRDNPISNPDRATIRRNYVLSRMHQLGHIDDQTYQDALSTPDDALPHTQPAELEAAFAAEMVRTEMLQRYGLEAYTGGYQVITTIDSSRQLAANQALQGALLDYDRRHGYRGPEGQTPVSDNDTEETWQAALGEYAPVGGLLPALVTSLEEQSAQVYVAGTGIVELPWEGMSWAKRYRNNNARGPAPKTTADILAPGDIVRVRQNADGLWELSQAPTVEGALVSLVPGDGAIAALTGGFDFYRSKFNRATQAQRQPGSSFKPFIYSAGLAKGFTAASVINDAPVVFDDPSLETTWRPENYSGKFYGPTRLREALTRSRNLVSVRLLSSIGPRYAVDYASRFGFDASRLPKDLSLALGSGSATPMDMARGYAVFANGGYAVQPYLIRQVLDVEGKVIEETNPAIACPVEDCETLEPTDADAEADTAPLQAGDTPAEPSTPTAPAAADADTTDQDLEMPPEPLPVRYAQRVITAQNAYLMTSMMRDVIKRGTGRRALALGRTDLAGKTGTTNDQRDAWFCGFNAALVTTAWVGFDQVQPLGASETGSRAALPMWIAYMGEALKDTPTALLPPPSGLVTVRIDPETGLLPAPGQDSELFETFRVEHVPEQQTEAPAGLDGNQGQGGETDPLF